MMKSKEQEKEIRGWHTEGGRRQGESGQEEMCRSYIVESPEKSSDKQKTSITVVTVLSPLLLKVNLKRNT